LFCFLRVSLRVGHCIHYRQCHARPLTGRLINLVGARHSKAVIGVPRPPQILARAPQGDPRPFKSGHFRSVMRETDFQHAQLLARENRCLREPAMEAVRSTIAWRLVIHRIGARLSRLLYCVDGRWYLSASLSGEHWSDPCSAPRDSGSPSLVMGPLSLPSLETAGLVANVGDMDY
jgi:hypothetical protein